MNATRLVFRVLFPITTARHDLDGASAEASRPHLPGIHQGRGSTRTGKKCVGDLEPSDHRQALLSADNNAPAAADCYLAPQRKLSFRFPIDLMWHHASCVANC